MPDGATTTNEYHLTGLLKKTWGVRQYPVQYAYDAQGRMTNMVTWQSFNLLNGAGASPATNTWQYDTNRGWLRLKGYPNASSGAATTNGPVYSYTAAGRLKTRSWVRTVAGGARLLTTYKFGFEGTDAARRHGDLIEVTYNDGTPGSTHSHDRRGRPTSVVRSNRTVSWTYNDADRPLTETNSGGTLAGWSIVRVYNAKLQRTHQRLRQSATTRQETRFGYDTAGRLSAMTNGLLTGLRAAYSY